MKQPNERCTQADVRDFDELIVCEYCDVVHRLTKLAEGERALCVRCGRVLLRGSEGSYRRLLPLVITALVLLILSNVYPIVEMDLKGVHIETTLFGAVQTLSVNQMTPVAILVFATTVMFPFAEVLLMLYLLVPLALHSTSPGFDRVARGIQITRPWGMLEVFMIGVMVALAKLSTFAQVLPGVALWSFSALVVVLAAILTFDPSDFWRLRETESKRWCL